MKFDAVPLRWLFGLGLLLALAACGGGGGGGTGEIRTISPGGSTLQGTWNRTITYDGTQSASASVGAASVPLVGDVAAFTTADVALFLVDRFPGKTVTRSGSTLNVTDAATNTNFTLVVNSFVAADYVDCGACTVGTSITFTITANITENGTFENQPISRTRNSVITLRFTRTA
jgi:hypothetical protein